MIVTHLVRLSVTLWTVACRLLCPWDSPSKNTGVDCHFLLQGIILTQGLNPGLLHGRQILYHLIHQGMLFLIYLALPFGTQLQHLGPSSLTRDRTQVPHIESTKS